MAVNEVIYNGQTLISLKNDTVTESTLGEGVKAHNAKGNIITGTAKIGTAETWVLTLEDGTTVTKAVFVE